jgi:hypothetical protein
VAEPAFWMMMQILEAVLKKQNRGIEPQMDADEE